MRELPYRYVATFRSCGSMLMSLFLIAVVRNCSGTGIRKEITLHVCNPSHTVYTIHISFPVPDTNYVTPIMERRTLMSINAKMAKIIILCALIRKIRSSDAKFKNSLLERRLFYKRKYKHCESKTNCHKKNWPQQ